VMLCNMLDDINGMNVFFEKLFGKCHVATSYSL